jgi:hypothetical protein
MPYLRAQSVLDIHTQTKRNSMKNLCILLALAIVIISCGEKAEKKLSAPIEENWNKRMLDELPNDSLDHGTSYLSIYSEIYSRTEHTTHDLTATVSLRNVNLHDTIYINTAAYYNTHGELRRSYFKKMIYIAPMETVEIVIDEVDKEGGTGANFLFHWSIPPLTQEPLFEGVMISTSGQQGLSFTTRGLRIE